MSCLLHWLSMNPCLFVLSSISCPCFVCLSNCIGLPWTLCNLCVFKIKCAVLCCPCTLSCLCVNWLGSILDSFIFVCVLCCMRCSRTLYCLSVKLYRLCIKLHRRSMYNCFVWVSSHGQSLYSILFVCASHCMGCPSTLFCLCVKFYRPLETHTCGSSCILCLLTLFYFVVVAKNFNGIPFRIFLFVCE